MNTSYAVAILAAAVLCTGCSASSTPTSPSAVQGRGSVAASAGGAGGQAASASSGGSQLVPFKGSLEGSQSLTPLQPPFAFVDGSATGTATHLGQFTVTFPHTVNFATSTGEGDYTFTAANGATLTAHFTGQAQLGAVDTIVETATVTGGTGRLSGVSGTFTVHRVADPATGTTTGTFEGAIAFADQSNP